MFDTGRDKREKRKGRDKSYVYNLERNWKNSQLSSLEKVNFRKFTSNFSCQKVNFSLIHPRHITTIHGFWRTIQVITKKSFQTNGKKQRLSDISNFICLYPCTFSEARDWRKGTASSPFSGCSRAETESFWNAFPEF